MTMVLSPRVDDSVPAALREKVLPWGLFKIVSKCLPLFVGVRFLVANKSQLAGLKKLARALLAAFAEAADFKPHHPDLKTAFPGDLFLQVLKRRAGVFHDRAAFEASHMAVIAIGLGFVIVFFALDVHEIEFVDQASLLEQSDGAVDGSAINRWIFLFGNLEQGSGVQVARGVLDDADQ